MRFSLILLIAPAAMALATMGEPMTGNFDQLETRSLEPRACKNTGCKCDTTRNRAPQGQFCGGCKCTLFPISMCNLVLGARIGDGVLIL